MTISENRDRRVGVSRRRRPHCGTPHKRSFVREIASSAMERGGALGGEDNSKPFTQFEVVTSWGVDRLMMTAYR